MEETREFAVVNLDEEFIRENDMLLSIYLWQIKNQCIDASGAYHDLRELESMPGVEHQLRESIWINVEAFLKDTSMLSKSLFPSSKMKFARDRGHTILSLLKLNRDDLPNLRSRKLRNRIEHFDEDLDKWWVKKKTLDFDIANFAIKTIDGLDDDIIYGPNPNLAFMYNPSTGILYHLDEEFEFHSIFADTVRVGKALAGAQNSLRKISGKTLTRESR